MVFRRFHIDPVHRSPEEKIFGSVALWGDLRTGTHYDPSGEGFSLTGGKLALEYLGGGLTVEGKTFNELSPYPLWMPGSQPGEPGSSLMKSLPGMPTMKTGPDFQFMMNADLLKLFPALKSRF